MKPRLLIAALLILTVPQVALAQYLEGFIIPSPYPFADACWIYEPEGGGIMEVYVVYTGFLCLLSAGFRVHSGEGFTGVYLDETVETSGLSLGNTQEGLTISFYMNPYGPVLLATIRYMTDGTSASCSHIEVVEHPEYGSIWVLGGDNCGRAELHFLGDPGPLLVNVQDASCIWCLSPEPVEPTTWGRIKALYTE